MNKFLFVFLMVFVSLTAVQAQRNKTDMPKVDIKGLDGKMVSAPDLLNGKLTVVSFWATWCKPCVKELNALQEVLPDWADELDFQLIAISIDDSRSEHRVAPFTKARAWDFPVFLDPNSDLKRALNAPTVPHTFVFNKDGKLVWQHSGYNEGDEEELYEQLTQLSGK